MNSQNFAKGLFLEVNIIDSISANIFQNKGNKFIFGEGGGLSHRRYLKKSLERVTHSGVLFYV